MALSVSSHLHGCVDRYLVVSAAMYAPTMAGTRMTLPSEVVVSGAAPPLHTHLACVLRQEVQAVNAPAKTRTRCAPCGRCGPARATASTSRERGHSKDSSTSWQRSHAEPCLLDDGK